jgi:hypothetical protein
MPNLPLLAFHLTAWQGVLKMFAGTNAAVAGAAMLSSGAPCARRKIKLPLEKKS